MPRLTQKSTRSVLLISLTASVLLAPLLLQIQGLTEWDAALFLDINAHFSHSPADTILWAITQLGSVEFLLALDMALFIMGKRKWAAYLLALLLCYSLVGYGMKFLVDRPRPYVTYPEIAHMTAVFHGSFPSGHALGISGLCALLYAKKSRFLAVAVLMATLVLFTRVFLGMHYPLDVIVGAWIGTLIGLLVGSFTIQIEDTMPLWYKGQPDDH
ncbi:MAG: phosphatase PAP2 family protein [Candidatus Methanomethylophilaceae archaeon]|nr:phosphatase PAP2 family protein [Candidatus Methanomethylophilaceae archaeon]